ncbi:MAG: Ig-like domain-containing protein, partial [Acidimicrobiia bacterium]|nr:Ig-like domain-containing protein [Acidimicrobiia bacterium]
VDFGIDAVGSIAGRVMIDVDGDGTDSGSEPPLSGITVVATWNGPDGIAGTGDDVAYTTTTDPAGNYLFGNIPAGDYEIAVTQPAGTVWSFDPDPTADGIDLVTLLSGQSVVGEDFGVAGAASITTRVYFDVDGDGVADAGEPGIEGVEVTVVWAGPDGLAGNADDIAYVVTTDAGGDLTVPYLMPGDYSVTVSSGTLPLGLTQTDDPDATVDGATSLTVNPAQAATAGVFGYTGTGAIGDTVFIDFDGDGIQDAGEPGVPGVAVVVTWAGQDGIAGTADDFDYVQVTDAGGTYLVPGLAAGSYVVALDPTTLPPGLGGAIPIAVSLAGGQIYLDADFGLGGNLPPIAIDDSAVTLEDEPVTIVVLGNDGDPEGHTVLVTAVTPPANGSASINADGTVTYVPDPDFSGVDTFTYTICEDTSMSTTGIAPTGECATATVTVTVTDVNDPPVNDGDTVITVTVGHQLPPLTFSDPEGFDVRFTLIGGALPPGLTLNPDGTFTGTARDVGTYTFVVRVCDTDGACTVVTFSIVVLPAPGQGGSGSEPSIPFTGNDSLFQAVVALMLILAGLVLLAVSRRQPEERANGER